VQNVREFETAARVESQAETNALPTEPSGHLTIQAHTESAMNQSSIFTATAGTAIVRLSHRNSVRPSVCHTGGSSNLHHQLSQRL